MITTPRRRPRIRPTDADDAAVKRNPEPEPERYLVCGCTPWDYAVYERVLRLLPGEWDYMSGAGYLSEAGPGYHDDRFRRVRYAFFLHWRWKVPPEIINATECVGFHLGSLSNQRGGSPLQWRILAGMDGSLLSMFRMTDDLDAGPLYAVREVRLDGAAEAVYHRVMGVAGEMITDFLEQPEVQRPHPHPVTGLAPPLPRRRPEESDLGTHAPTSGSLEELYDLIRCVDAPGYPRAFLERGGFRYTFRRAVFYGERIEADVTITPAPVQL